jgi:hypothetical protein
MSNYASVTEQSGLQAGDKGFQVDVKGNTDLRGAVIASTDKALHDGNNRLATRTLTKSDIENRADYSASSIGINIGTGTSLSGALAPFGSGVGFGSDSGHSASTTLSGITSIAGNIGVRTGDSATGIARIFDANKVEKDVGAQVQITQTFGQQASKAVGDYMGKQTTILKLAAGQEDDPTKKQILLDEAQKWDEGGTYRVLAHTVIGGLTGGVQGAAGASAAALYANAINKATADLPEGVRNVVGAAIASGLGAAVGGTAGAATAFNEDTNNRQLHVSEIEKLKRKAAELARAGLTGRDASESDRTKATNYWFDLLSSEALAIVDTKARDVRESYLAQISATRAPGLEGQLNADRYLQDAGIARQIVASMSGDILLGSDGKPITADGSVLRSFQATERQFTDTQLFLARDRTTLTTQFDNPKAGVSADAGDSSLENRVTAAGRLAREEAQLAKLKTSTEGVTRVYPELDVLAGAPLVRQGIKLLLSNTSIVEVGLASLVTGGKGGAYTFDAMNPGPLPDAVAGTFAGGRYSVGTVQPAQRFFKAGDASNPGGSFFSFDIPQSVAQTRIDNAIKPFWIDPSTGAITGSSPINSVINAQFPLGTPYYFGPVGTQGGIYLGGKDRIQIFILNARSIGTFTPIGPLK